MPKEFELAIKTLRTNGVMQLKVQKTVGTFYLTEELLADAKACRPLVRLRTIDGKEITRHV